MSSHIQKLPNELLILTFGYVDPVAQIAQCRLVCQEWNRIAQPLMLTKNLTIASEEKANQLYHYLLDYPHQAARIKNLNINLQYGFRHNAFNKLISLAFTPTMEYLSGLANDKKFFEALMVAADKYDTSSIKLKSLPYYAKDGYHFYNAALFKFKHTLESVHLTSFNVLQMATANQLSSFEKLKKIHIDFSSLSEVLKLDRMLMNCSQVEELGIHLVNHNPWGFYGLFFPTNRDTVQQNPTIKTLCMYGECNLKLMELLMHKYPHVNRVAIDTIQCDSRFGTLRNRTSMRVADISKIVDLLHDKALYSIKFRLQQGSTIKLIKEHILRQGGKILMSESFGQSKMYSTGFTSTTGGALKIKERVHYIEATNNKDN